MTGISDRRDPNASVIVSHVHTDRPYSVNQRLFISLAAFVGWTAITVVGGNIRSGGEGPLLDAVTQGPGWPFVIAAGFILAVVLWQRWNDVGLCKPSSARSLLLAWLPLTYIVGGLGFTFALGLPPAGVWLWILLNTFFVGFSEELMFRGALLQAFRRTVSIWPAVLLTSFLFGAIHSLNVFMTGDLRSALIQSIAALLSGLFFIALRLRTGSLWPSIIVHCLWDFATFTLLASQANNSLGGGAPTGLMMLAPVLLVLPNALYGLWLMRNIGRTHTHPQT
jgi:uncharacterized protein